MGGQGLQEWLSVGFGEAVRDPVWGNVHLTEALADLTASRPFAKLGGIKQLGPAYLVYPGATHSRLAHSLGVFHCARRLLLALASREALAFVTREGAMSFLAAALCHDLGHFPFAHSLKELPLEEHESLGAKEVRREPLRSLVGASGADPEATAAIIDPSLPGGEGREIRFFRGLLSGVLDPDKLDYLTRDAYFCGVPYGVQDVDHVLERLCLGRDDRAGVDAKGLISVESVLFAKYLMYRSVYWHHGVRASTAMVKKAVFLALEEGVLLPEELYGLDDAGFFSLLAARDFGPFSLAAAVLERRPLRLLLDLPFDCANRAQTGLLDLKARLAAEEAIAAAGGLGPLDLVIDLPEPISFESDLPIVDPGSGTEEAFASGSTVFSEAVVGGFARALRRLRVFARRPDRALRAAAERSLS
jgi:HD superfamily phosphohydrolase